MKAVLILLFSALIWINGVAAEPNKADSKYEGLVILEIKGLDYDTYTKIQQSLYKAPKLNLEYGCVENDIIVVKFLDSDFAAEADNAKLVQNAISKDIDKKEVKQVFVKVRLFQGSSKC